eukprot:395215-Amphidinium_carterae.1
MIANECKCATERVLGGLLFQIPVMQVVHSLTQLTLRFVNIFGQYLDLLFKLPFAGLTSNIETKQVHQLILLSLEQTMLRLQWNPEAGDKWHVHSPHSTYFEKHD